MNASHLRIGNIVALEYNPAPQRIMVLSPGCIYLENCPEETVETAVIPVPVTGRFLNQTGVNNFIQIQQPDWYKMYVRPLESLNNYLHSFKEEKQVSLTGNNTENIVPVRFYLGNTFLLEVSCIHHLQNVFFNLSRGQELFPFPFNPYPEKNIR
ncbi:MAG: hypothetical protein LBE82_00165 [Chitinophagaceae bacterium]|jgi:hypothetical protein|nr:hypothetical protein [Chitinophagaceae bacterium]